MHLDHVPAGGQSFEIVEPTLGGDLRIDRITVGHTVARLVDVQQHRHAVDALLARGHQSVVVGVQPHAIAKRMRLRVPDVDAVIDQPTRRALNGEGVLASAGIDRRIDGRARNQRPAIRRRRHGRGRRCSRRHDRCDRRHGRGRRCSRRRRCSRGGRATGANRSEVERLGTEVQRWRRLDLHGRPNSQLGDAGGDPDPADAVRVVRESKAAALVGDHRVFAAIGRQRDGHPFQTRLGWPLQSIAIGIDPHPIADLDDRISCHRARHDGHAHDVTTVGELHQVARGRTDGSGHVSGGYARCLHPAGPARKVIDHVRAVAGVGGDDRRRLADGNGRHAMPSRGAGDELRRARTRCARRRPLLVGQPASVLLGLLRRRCLATKIAFRCVLGGTCHTCQQLRSSGVHRHPLDLADLVAIVHDPGRGNAGGADRGALDTLTGSWVHQPHRDRRVRICVINGRALAVWRHHRRTDAHQCQQAEQPNPGQSLRQHRSRNQFRRQLLLGWTLQHQAVGLHHRAEREQCVSRHSVHCTELDPAHQGRTTVGHIDSRRTDRGDGGDLGVGARARRHQELHGHLIAHDQIGVIIEADAGTTRRQVHHPRGIAVDRRVQTHSQPLVGPQLWATHQAAHDVQHHRDRPHHHDRHARLGPIVNVVCHRVGQEVAPSIHAHGQRDRGDAEQCDHQERIAPSTAPTAIATGIHGRIGGPGRRASGAEQRGDRGAHRPHRPPGPIADLQHAVAALLNRQTLQDEPSRPQPSDDPRRRLRSHRRRTGHDARQQHTQEGQPPQTRERTHHPRQVSRPMRQGQPNGPQRIVARQHRGHDGPHLTPSGHANSVIGVHGCRRHDRPSRRQQRQPGGAHLDRPPQFCASPRAARHADVAQRGAAHHGPRAQQDCATTCAQRWVQHLALEPQFMPPASVALCRVDAISGQAGLHHRDGRVGELAAQRARIARLRHITCVEQGHERCLAEVGGRPQPRRIVRVRLDHDCSSATDSLGGDLDATGDDGDSLHVEHVAYAGQRGVQMTDRLAVEADHDIDRTESLDGRRGVIVAGRHDVSPCGSPWTAQRQQQRCGARHARCFDDQR